MQALAQSSHKDAADAEHHSNTHGLSDVADVAAQLCSMQHWL